MRRTNAGINVGKDKIRMLLHAKCYDLSEELQSLFDAADGFGRDFVVRCSSEKVRY